MFFELVDLMGDTTITTLKFIQAWLWNVNTIGKRLKASKNSNYSDCSTLYIQMNAF